MVYYIKSAKKWIAQRLAGTENEYMNENLTR